MKRVPVGERWSLTGRRPCGRGGLEGDGALALRGKLDGSGHVLEGLEDGALALWVWVTICLLWETFTMPHLLVVVCWMVAR